jgi:3-oxoacyl-[acyl-carrier-protein] synthase III
MTHSTSSYGADIRIVGIGSYLPARREANAARLAEFGIDEAFLHRKLGIVSRAVKDADETISDLCIQAYRDLTAQMAIAHDEIELCCVVTQNPDHAIPHTAAILHHRLELPRACMTFDISQGCAGYACGLAIVSAVMERLGLQRALLFTCDPYSKIVDRDDKNTALIFGDAASVSYLARRGPGYALVDASFGTAPGSSACLRSDGVLKMDGSAVLMNAAREVPASIRGLLAKHGLTLAEIDRVLLHPGSKRVVELIRSALELDGSKAPFEIASYGNTVSSSIPLMLKQPLNDQVHQRLVLSGFGVGFSWGSCLVELRH